MEYESIFDFLENDERFSDVYNICISMEKSIISNSYNASLILSRTASELIMKLLVDNSEFRMEFFKKDKDGNYIVRNDGSYAFISLKNLIIKSKEKNIIGKKIQGRYTYLRKVGNSNVHGEKLVDYGIKDCEKAHRFLFLISQHGYNRLNNENINLNYENKLNNYDFTIEISPQERYNQINNVRFNEVDTNTLIFSYQSKNIFIPINSFKSILNKYEEELFDKNKFLEDLSDFEYISFDNLHLILNYFDESVRSDITVDIHELHNQISNNVLKTLDELNKSNLTFEELNSLINGSEDSHQKEIYSNIKTLADDLVKNYLDEYIKELQSAPVTDFADNGRKLLKYKNYDIVEDEYGFSLKEVDENIFLDDNQIKAVEYDGEKPLVINAGPGSGKTRVIIERVVNLVKNNRKPSSILVITFTRKATQELKERLINETELHIKDINQIRISTVHGFCRHLVAKYEHLPYNYLTRHGERSLFLKKYKKDLGFTRYAFLYDHWIPKVLEKYDEYFSFNLYDKRLINYLEQKMSDFEKNNWRYKYYIDNFYKTNDEDTYPVLKQLKSEKINGASYYYRWLNIVKSYPKFFDLMEESSTCDDNTVLVKANEILENDIILNQIPYKNILIDEFQDTDHIQKDIFEKLLKISDTFTIVGDADQSIYGWRGAYPEYFESFTEKDVEKVTLHNNYRSSRNIVEFNEELIKGKRTIPKELYAKKKYKAPIFHMTNPSVDDEASRIVELIINLKNDKIIKYYSDVAILFRKNKSVDNLIKPLNAAGIDYYLKENNDFLDQDEVKAMLTLFWYLMPYDKYEIYHLGDEFLNLYGFTDVKYTSSHIFKLSNKTMDLLSSIQEEFENKVIKKAKSVYSFKKGILPNFKYQEIFDLDDDIKKEIFEDLDTFDIASLDKTGLINLGITSESDLEFFLKLREIKMELYSGSSQKRITTLKLFYDLLNLTDYFSEISIENNPEYIKIKDNLALFSHIIKDYESIMGDEDYLGLFIYLSRVLKGYSCRQNEFDEGFDKVHLLSMHSAKGLEYPIVILGSIKQGICPLEYGKDDGLYPTPNVFLEYKETNEKLDEKKYNDEELRTIYVATTRAKEILILSSIGNNQNDVPEFLDNIKRSPNISIEMLEPYNLDIIPKIESSKVFKQKNDFPRVKFEDILDDFLYCDYRYDLANNTRFKVKLRNDKYVNMVLHKLLNSVHKEEKISLGMIDAKIKTVLDYHNVSSSSDVYEIIQNVREYWLEYGSNYEIVDSNLKRFFQLQYCDMNCVIDLVIKENGKLSVVHFIASDENIPDIELYLSFLIYYINILKDSDEFKEYEFNKVYLHSLKNNYRHEYDYDEESEEEVLEYIDEFTKAIHDNVFDKFRDNCETCEYYGNVCRG